MSATIREIVDDALTIIGEAAGAGVQEFADDRMIADCIRAFNLMFKKYRWHQYRQWFRVELDGVLGIPTTNAFEQIKDFEDFISVHNDTYIRPLPIFPGSANPYNTAYTTGSQVRFWTSMTATNTNYNKRKLQFYPKTSTGFVNVHAMVYPLVPPATRLTAEDSLYLDRDLLSAATAFMTLATDDLNPGAADVARSLMETKYKAIMALLASHPIPIEGATNIPMDWSVAP